MASPAGVGIPQLAGSPRMVAPAFTPSPPHIVPADLTDTSTLMPASAGIGQQRSVSRGKWAQLDKVTEDMITKLKRREIHGSSGAAIHTAELLRTVVANGAFVNVDEMTYVIRRVGQTLSTGNPMELAIGNIVRRVLCIIRQECAALIKEKQQQGTENHGDVNVDLSLSLHKLLDEEKKNESDYTEDAGSIGLDFYLTVKPLVIEEINELIDEIKTVYSSIADQAVEHIHAQEVILTYGVSKTVVHFLKEAAKLRKFEVFVAESAPSFSGHSMAVELSQLGIATTVITDSAVFALMPAVNKVIIGTHAVMANGGLVTHTGANNIAVAAKAHSVPFVVVTGLYKLCPLYAFSQDTFNELRAPSQVLRFDKDVFVEKVDVENPAYDYVAPELVSLFITNFGGHNPSYIYRLLAEYYNPEDYEL